MRFMKIVAAASMLVALACGSAMATPSTQIWIPSTDVKAFKEVHIDIDNYTRFSSKADAGFNTYDVGVTVGVLPLEKIKLEVGIDYITDGLQGNGSLASKNPINFNFKAGVPEEAFFKGMPAVAAGMYGINTANDALSANIAYGLIAKTFPVIGRLSVGGYNGTERYLSPGSKGNNGILASWDRTMSEISDKLWLAVDYMGGNNTLGAVSVGGSWAFTPNVSLLVGVNVYNPGQQDLPGGKPTFTTQLDINF